jgi:UDP-GlcNAc3NAcA epimerase
LKILTVIGARPQFIKAAALSNAISSRSGIEEILVHTGQHFDANMSDIFFDELRLPKPAYHLHTGGGSHAEMVAAQLVEIEKLAKALKPDVLLVYGDTNSTLSAALVASKLHIPVAHVEAGLRSFNRRMPEEVNRVLTDHLSSFLFAPSKLAYQNLRDEGISHEKITVTGDIMCDAVRQFLPHALELHKFKVPPQFGLVTLHRAELTEDTALLKSVLSSLQELGKKIKLVWPVHPRTKKVIDTSKLTTDNVSLVEPVGYLEMLSLMKHAKFMLTDSGGIQKEAYLLGTPCITLRAETEWVETVKTGWNRLLSPEHAESQLVDYYDSLCLPGSEPRLAYGDGHAASLILDAMVANS